MYQVGYQWVCTHVMLILSTITLCPLQLEDGHTLFDYDVGLNDIVQLMIRPVLSSLYNGAQENGDQDMTVNGGLANGNGDGGMNGHSHSDSDQEMRDMVSACLAVG